MLTTPRRARPLIVLAALCGPPAASAGAPVVDVPLVDPAWDELVPGARVRLLVTTGATPERVTRTVPADCVEVREVTSSGVRVALSRADGRLLAGREPGSEVRAALCHSDATPLAVALPPDRYAMLMPPRLPHALVHLVRTGDHVDLLASLPRGEVEEDKTATFLTGLEVAPPPRRDSRPALLLTAEEAEKVAHATAVGTVSLTIRAAPPQDPHTTDRMSALIPAGMVIMGTVMPRRLGLPGFLVAGDYFDLLVDVDGRLVVPMQALLAIYPMPDHREPVDSLAALATPEQAELWTHASTFLPTGYALRNPADTVLGDYGAPGPATPPSRPDLAGMPVSTRISEGMRGVDIPYGGSVPPVVGSRVALAGSGCPAEVLVLAVTPAAASPETNLGNRVLVEVMPAEALAVLHAEHGCAVPPPPGP